MTKRKKANDKDDGSFLDFLAGLGLGAIGASILPNPIVQTVAGRLSVESQYVRFVELNWNGNDLVEDLNPIQKFFSRPKSRKGIALQGVAAGFALLISQFGSITITTPQETMTIELLSPEWRDGFVIWAFASLIALANVLFQKSILTPEIKNPRCNWCGHFMATSKLICLNCRKKSG